MTPRRRWRDLGAERHGTSAVEFAIVCFPFLFMMLYVLQIGLYYMTQSALDVGVNNTADTLRKSFTSGAAPTLPGAAALKAAVVTNAGGLVAGDGNLAVEIRQLATLSTAVVPIADGIADYGGTTSTLVLRAQGSVIAIAPWFSSLTKVASTQVVRRQGR